MKNDLRIFYFWFPLWGLTLSLLYLSRTHTKKINENGATRQKRLSFSSHLMTSSMTGLLNPLVSEDDFYSGNFTDLEDAFRETQVSNSTNKSVMSRHDIDNGEEASSVFIGGGRASRDAESSPLLRPSLLSSGNAMQSTPSRGMDRKFVTPSHSSYSIAGDADTAATPSAAAAAVGAYGGEDEVEGGDPRESEGDSSIDTLIEQNHGKVIFSPNHYDVSYPFRSEGEAAVATPDDDSSYSGILPRTSESYKYFRAEHDASIQQYLNVPHSVSFDAFGRDSISPNVAPRDSTWSYK